MPASRLHFSEDPTITRFVPHVPAPNPGHRPAVWAIDAHHEPLYWFPRDCPRVALWPRPTDDHAEFRRVWQTTAPRVHAIENRWLDALRWTAVYRYTLPTAPFRPWPAATGQYVAYEEIEPLGVEPVGDLLTRHGAAGIELRLVPSLSPLRELATAGPFEFSIVRWRNATP